MKTLKTLFPILSAAMLVLTACEKELIDESADSEAALSQDSTLVEDASQLTIVTRSTSSEPISYPVVVYVMNSDGDCLHQQTLASATDELSLRLFAGTYQVYAVGGADASVYSLPTADAATADTEIALLEGAAHTDLMQASSTVTIGRNENNHLTLSFARKVMKVSSVQITDMPDDATSVAISLAPLYKGLSLDGSYVAGALSATIDLVKQSDGTSWANASPLFILPSEGVATITVRMTRAGRTTKYIYTTTQQLQANSELNISGRYTGDAGEFSLSGVFSGPTWGDPTNIDFTFDENGAQGTVSGGSTSGEGTANSDAAPAVKSWYKNCYVFMSADEGDETVVTLLHRSEVDIAVEETKSNADYLAEINAALPDFAVNGITDWRLPTEDEAKQIHAAVVNKSGVVSQGGKLMTADERYFYDKGNNEVGAFLGKGDISSAFATKVMHLRPVTTLRFSK